MTAVETSLEIEGGMQDLVDLFVGWLETGVRPDELFTDDVFCDLSVPLWRFQAQGLDEVFQVRETSHPFTGRIHVEAWDRTSRGFLVQFEECWEAQGQQWYCREQIHCVVTDGRIGELAIYCTGDWDQALQVRHAEQVTLLRP